MNRQLVIAQIVRQNMVLIAHLATQGGTRAPLFDVAERVFRGLVDELVAQRLSHKVIADMFGLALRTYYDRVRRLAESSTMRGRSLWEAVHEHVRERAACPRSDVLMRFRHDDEATVKAVLTDLVDSGLLARSGRGDETLYVAVPAPDARAPATFLALVQVALFHRGTATAEALADALGADLASVLAALATLVEDGRAELHPAGQEPERYSVQSCLIPPDDSAGFEAAIIDHVQAVVGALCHRLRRRGEREPIDQAIGGSTYTFDIAADNPTWGRVTRLLAEQRQQLSALRAEADAFEAARLEPAPTTRFIFYCGQNALAESLDAVDVPDIDKDLS